MTKYLSVDEIIKKAAEKKINLGKGDPYNRLRYYTKIGWLPHMKRLKIKGGKTVGHYPLSVMDRLASIEDMKRKGMTNDEIASRIQLKDRAKNFYSLALDEKTRTKFIKYASFILIVIILISELGIIKIGQQKDSQIILQNTGTELTQNLQIIASGNAIVLEGDSETAITVRDIRAGSQVYVSFNEDYSPATRYWIAEITPGRGFTLMLDTPIAETAEFSWWVTN